MITKIDNKQKETIQQILTLRYSKNWDNLNSIIMPKDLEEDISITNHEEFIENSIRKSIREQIDTNQKNVVKHRDNSISKYIKDLDGNFLELIKYED